MTDISSDPKDEYKAINDNLRWYSNVRLAQLTLFFAVIAVLSSRAFGSESEKYSLSFILAIKFGGLLSTLLFLYLEHRADEFWSHFMQRAVALEAELKYDLFTNRPKSSFRTTRAIKLFFIAIAIFWGVSICKGPHFGAPPSAITAAP